VNHNATEGSDHVVPSGQETGEITEEEYVEEEEEFEEDDETTWEKQDEAIKTQREEASQSLRKQGEQMLLASLNRYVPFLLNRYFFRYGPINVGKTVLVAIPGVDRPKAGARSLLAVVMEANNGFYR
jgi:hypothetical protein